MIRAVFLVHVTSTLMVGGIMWFIQLVHYPLLRHVGRDTFIVYEAAHTRRSISLVVSLMVIESTTAGSLLWWRPGGVTVGQVWTGLALLVAIWLSTFLLQVPQHRILASGFAPAAHRLLVRTNWIRTWSYTARAALVVWMVSRALRT